MQDGQDPARGLHGHYVICNWNDLGDAIVQQLHAAVAGDRNPILVVTDDPGALPQGVREVGADANGTTPHDPYFGVMSVHGDPAIDQMLRRAYIETAATAIVLADRRQGDYQDTKSVLIALAIEAIRPEIHTIVELQKSKNRIHFEHTSVDEIVCMDELTEKLISQAALTHGLTDFYMRLLTATDDTNEVYVVPVPEQFVNGKLAYRDLELALIAHDGEDVIPVGIRAKEDRLNGHRKVLSRTGDVLKQGVLTINPPSQKHLDDRDDLQKLRLRSRDEPLQPGDQLFVIAYHPPTLAGLRPVGR